MATLAKCIDFPIILNNPHFLFNFSLLGIIAFLISCNIKRYLYLKSHNFGLEWTMYITKVSF